MPSAATTRWQGISRAKRLRAQNEPTARCARVAGERCELPVADDLAARDGAQGGGDLALERRAPGEVERDIVEADRRSAEEGREPLHELVGIDVAGGVSACKLGAKVPPTCEEVAGTVPDGRLAAPSRGLRSGLGDL